jgi:hypothetical protein
MQRRTTTRLLTATALLAVFGTLALASGGCYRKVVDSRGLGADSTKLRSEYEHQPAHYTTQRTYRDNREVRPAREREKP